MNNIYIIRYIIIIIIIRFVTIMFIYILENLGSDFNINQ